MAVSGKSRHYDLYGIHRWHWVKIGSSLGLTGVPVMVGELIEQAPVVLDEISSRLPDGYPPAVFESIQKGMLEAAKRLGSEPDRRRNGDAP
jgi:serine/threonine-protein kinase HipA